MSHQPTQPNDTSRTVDSVMKRVGAVSGHFDLSAIRFVDCQFSHLARPSDADGEVRVGVYEQEVLLAEEKLDVKMLFEFLAPSPLQEEESERDKQVTIRTRLTLEYTIPSSRGPVEKSEAELFGRVNSIYNAWPYLREYVQSCLSRLGLPPFELPLLRAGAAAQLAGVIDSSKSDQKAEAAKT